MDNNSAAMETYACGGCVGWRCALVCSIPFRFISPPGFERHVRRAVFLFKVILLALCVLDIHCLFGINLDFAHPLLSVSSCLFVR